MTLEILTSDALAPLRHGFFTRRGGASSGVFSGLNCGSGSSDQSEIVRINRARAAEAMGLPADHLVGVHQVHSATVVTVTEPQDDKPRADALVTKTPGIALSILTADCQPVLFADAQAGVVGAAHAGWRGALDGILEATVDAMVDLGATREKITAVIGPSISQRAYEVGPEFLDNFMNADPEFARYFAQGEGDRLHFDLPGFGLNRLRAAGVGHAEWTRHCTYADASRFYSYRRTTHAKEADYGRLLSAITL
ncbi:peptidoglycan editing factor PgeF [Sulfitobacter sp. KE29]|uniref:peptidoglycan editing factor PgeF n=1 Tax=Sulfitobacter TaxID=60136 RepID=UPI0007C3F176|nr:MULTISPECIES: peptidoglycan editing factor PgeF [Sulfitobacter]KZY50078.1 polyphenol oxidase [Sulfitobacter sp. HI0054]MBO9438317.1 peptidoglycan editing factor PgeF [Sulfitobacter sp. R18_2]MDF3418370.1 peptidoglycan editing factor PgeF [Sulfitobacter sp. Ks38]MDF3425853.1 peptidoglycan editing factor PgeF [Sulfitobacter sp. KE29]MDF3429433.1 peptidoglycan editing factor PgeF [Sulfitobacter sp. S46]